MRVLILGAGGMLGHKLWQVFQDRFETWGTVRGRSGDFLALAEPSLRRIIQGTDAANMDSVISALARARPDAVVNCIGIIKQLPEAKDRLTSILINSLFPHRLAQLCMAAGTRLIHVSTDCVFSGRKGNYREDDFPDADDLYGRSKFLGEVTGDGCLTMRTSIVGRSLHPGPALIDWFIGQRSKSANGYARVMYSGLTTLALAEVMADVVENHSQLSGLWHVSSDPISKYDLLGLVNRAFDLGVEIRKDEDTVSDRSLDSSRFRQATGYRPPTWPEMVVQMAKDSNQYERK